MTIKNLDREVKNDMEMKEQFLNALNSGNEEEMAKAFTNFANSIQQNILKEAQSIVNEDLTDRQVLANRGLKVLTKEETTYYNEVISGNGFAGTEKLVPATVIDRVFEDLVQKHELLQYIDFVSVAGITEFITKNGEISTSFWGKLTGAHRELLDDGFKKISIEQYKLSAFIPVAKSMLALGATFLDKYVRTVLSESIAIGLEDAIIKGTGKEQPIGMVKNLAGAVVDGVYPDKTAKAITNFEPATLGKEVMAPLTKGGKRAIANVLMIVNPLDYWEKVFPATTVLTQNGTYAHGVLPIPAKVIQSVSVPVGKMIAGVASDYFLGMGARQKIEVSNEVRFIEDESIYLARLYANGTPKDNDSFLVFDITGVGAPAV